ncbi:MAG: cache domain-containing protein, partial [Planctomycetota bacterium]
AAVALEDPGAVGERRADDGATTPWRDAGGTTRFRVAVTAHPLPVPLAAVDATGRAASAVIVALLLLVVVRLAGRAALRPGAGLLSLLDFAIVVVLARIAMYYAGFPSAVLSGEVFDPTSFSYPFDPFGLDLGLLYSPGDLVLTALGVIAITAVALTFAARRFPATSIRPRPRTGILLLVPAILVAVLAVALWYRFLHLLPFYSTVEFFPEQSVTPGGAAAAILLGAFLLTLPLLAWTSSILLVPARLIAGESAAKRSLVLAAMAPPMAAAFLLLTGQPAWIAPLTAVVTVVSAAVFAAWPVLGVGIRLAVFTGLATLLTFGPFTNEVWEETLADVADRARELFRAAPETPLEQRLTADLEEIARDDRLVAALAEAPERERPDLAFTLWAEGPLSRHPRGSDLMVLSRSGNRILSRFEIDMPPRSWLPAPLPGYGTQVPHVQPRPGRDRGSRQVFLVGTAPVTGDDGEFLGLVVVRMPRERPLIGEARRPDLLRSLDAERAVRPGRELYYSEYAGDRLEYTTNPAYPRVHRAPKAAVEEILDRGGSRRWVREKVGGTTWMNSYRPRYEEGRRTGLRSVGFRTTATRSLFLAFFKLLLVNAIAAAAAALVAFATDLRRFSLRFQHKLLISYLVVSAVPVLLLAEVNRTVARETVEEQMEDSLRRAMRRVKAELRDRGTFQDLADAMRTAPARRELLAVVSNGMLKEIGYRLG